MNELSTSINVTKELIEIFTKYFSDPNDRNNNILVEILAQNVIVWHDPSNHINLEYRKAYEHFKNVATLTLDAYVKNNTLDQTAKYNMVVQFNNKFGADVPFNYQL